MKAILKSPLNNLTYQKPRKIEIGTKQIVKLRNRKVFMKSRVVKDVEKPTFECTNISEITNEYFDEKMLQISNFVSTIYVCSLGEALSVYNPFNKELKFSHQLKHLIVK